MRLDRGWRKNMIHPTLLILYLSAPHLNGIINVYQKQERRKDCGIPQLQRLETKYS
jgi:hypothetical protein